MEVCEEFYNLIEKQMEKETINTFNEGIIIIVDTKEKAFNKNFRIVCISTHKKWNNLKNRRDNHLKNKAVSILRTHIGRISNQNESDIRKYLQRFEFILLQTDYKARFNLKEKIIGTLVNCQESKASKNWLGNKSSTKQIKSSGLWLVQYIGTTERLTIDDLKFLIIKEVTNNRG